MLLGRSPIQGNTIHSATPSPGAAQALVIHLDHHVEFPSVLGSSVIWMSIAEIAPAGGRVVGFYTDAFASSGVVLHLLCQATA
jgi:hypothetical protein